MKGFLLGILTLVLLLGCASSELTTAQVENQKRELLTCKKQNDGNLEPCVEDQIAQDVGLSCKVEAQTGTRVGKRVCTTAYQREFAREHSKEMLNRMQRTGHGQVTP